MHDHHEFHGHGPGPGGGGPHGHGRRGPWGFGPGFGPGFGFGDRPGPRAGRGDVRTAVLVLLGEEPMHGYQIIREIEERSEGTWKPSPGSVYPTLQLLADEGLLEVEEDKGRKTYSLTESGRDESAKAKDKPLPWASDTESRFGPDAALPKAGVKLGQAVAQVVSGGSKEQTEAAVKVIDDARKKIYQLLAQD